MKADAIPQEELQRLADTMARELTRRETDPNEVSSALATLRSMGDGRRFFTYLDTVVKDGRAVVRSGKTLNYYRGIREACKKHLAPYQDQPRTMAQVLGWAIRLMRFQKVEDKLPLPPAAKTVSKPKLAKPAAGANRQTGRVKWFNAGKGFGFIERDNGGDIFFHHSKLAKDFENPAPHTRVSFIIGKGRKGDEARDVRPA